MTTDEAGAGGRARPDEELQDPGVFAVRPRGVRVLPPAPNVGAVAAGGVLGATARWALGAAIPTAAGAFPATTLAVNVTGALVLAVALELIAEHRPGWPLLRPFLCTGILGGYTTFSTMCLEMVNLTRGGSTSLAAIYLAASLLGGAVATVVGTGLARATSRRTARHEPNEDPDTERPR